MEQVILVVDDVEDNRLVLSMRLEACGFSNLLMAENGRDALEKMRQGPVDLILLDIMMPELDGYGVLAAMRDDPALRDLPVVVISALEDLGSVVRCIELGAEDYLVKPFNPTLLRARVGASLEKKRLRDAVRASLDRLEQELDAARTLQRGMLPREFPAWTAAQPVQVHGWMEPAREVGGDFYDCFYAADDVFCFMVGDVSGKGAPAAMFMARTLSSVRMAIAHSRELRVGSGVPARIAETVNRELYQNNPECMFVTLLLGFLDTRTGALSYVNAGHPAPYLLTASGDVAQIDAKADMPLGVRHDIAYQGRTTSLRPGDAIFLCTDGVVEATDLNEDLYGEERLDANLRAVATDSPEKICELVRERVDGFTGAAPKADDITLLALRWHAAAT